MTSVELRMNDLTIALFADRASDAVEAIRKEANRRGILFETWRDNRTKENVIRLTGEGVTKYLTDKGAEHCLPQRSIT